MRNHCKNVILKSVKILHLADIHIGAAQSFLGAGANMRRYETLMTFERIIDTAREQNVQVIAAAGDIFDSNNVPEELIAPVFAKITAVPDIKVVFAAGNHDPLTAESPFKTRKLPQNLYVLGVTDDCITFDDIKLRVYGRSFESVYMAGEERFSLAPPDDNYINLMVLHGDMRSDMGSPYNSVTPRFIESSGMDYIALGHIHKRTEIQRLGKTFFAYSGCPEGMGFDELGEKGVYMGEISKGENRLEFLLTARRMCLYEKIDVTGSETNAAAAEKILAVLKEKYGENYAENLFKIELTGTADVNTAEIQGRLGALYFVKLRDKTESPVNYDELSREISLKGLFVKNMLSRLNAAEKEEKENLKEALKLGLKAFDGEVSCDEN